MRFVPIFAVAALVTSGCNEILRRPDVNVGDAAIIGEELQYDISAFEVTPQIVARANQMPFTPLVTIDGATTGPAVRVGVEQALDERLPSAGPRPAYALGAGDVIRISRVLTAVGGSGLEAEQLATTDYRVAEDGYIDLSDAGRVFVGGKSVDQARAAIETAYGARSDTSVDRVEERLFPETTGQEYVIGAADVLSVSFIISSTSLAGDTSRSVVSSSGAVGPDGVVNFLQVGQVEVGGLTLAEAQQRVSQAALRANALTDEVQLNIQQFASQSVIVTGDVGSAVVPITSTVFTYDRIIAERGLAVSSNSDYLVTLERDNATYQMRASTLLRAENRGRFGAQDGDRLIVRRLSATPEFRISVIDFNAQKVTFLDVGSGSPAVVPLTDEGLDLRTLLISRSVKVARDVDALVRLVRGSTEYRSSASRLMIEEPGRKVWLMPGDSVLVEPLEYVPSKAVIVGQVGSPKPYVIDQAARTSVSEALFSSGLFSTPAADFKHIYVLRQQAGANYDAYHFDLTEVLNLGLADQMELRPGDVVFVRLHPLVKFNQVVDILIGLDDRRIDVASRL